MVLAFNGGGYFAGVTGAVAAALGLVLVLRLTLADEPFAGLGRMAIAAVAALGLFAGLVLASAIWSDAPARAMIEFDRALLYWLALFLFASLGYSIRRLAWATRLVALAILAICAVSLTTRLLPDLLATQEGFEIERLSYPLTYWNALGLLASLGTLLCFHLTASEREPGPVRVAAAAALPVLAGCLFFTFSRGAVAALALGLILYVLAARPYALLSALLATAPAVAVVLASAYGAEALSGDNPTSPLAVDQGGDVALVLALCVVGAGALRWLLLLLDARVGAALSRRRPSRRMAIAGVGVAAAVLVAALHRVWAAGLAGAAVRPLPRGQPRQQQRRPSRSFHRGGQQRTPGSVAGGPGRVRVEAARGGGCRHVPRDLVTRSDDRPEGRGRPLALSRGAGRARA